MPSPPDKLIGLGRRLQKLRAMPPAELAHRVRYKLAIMRERRAYGSGTLARPDRLRAALRADLQADDWQRRVLDARRAAAAVFPSLQQRDRIRALFASRYTAEHADMQARAADTRAHRFSFFGQTFTYGRDIPWQHDPVTGKPWPSGYHADVPVHRGDIGCGDVKHVWELSRQQYLVDLGRAVFLDDDRESLASLEHLVRSWIAGNPYGTGVHWSCALEPAFRAFSWVWAYGLSQHALDNAFHLEWLCGMYDAARFIEAHLEHYSSPYNHLLGEASALYLLGATFPEFADAARWRQVARTVLERRLPEQFYADGGTVEQSTFYHHASVGDYLLAVLAARQVGESFSPAVWTAIERGLEFSLALTQPDGRTPEIGGADDGKPIRMEHLPLWDFRPYLAIGAVLFQRGDFKTVAGRFHEDALWLLGADALDAFERVPATTPAHAAIALPHSGYYVMRSDWTPGADCVVVDCGEQAFGMRPDAVPNSMHGHADCLSVLVTLGGRRVLIDSGFFAYNSGGAWEAHFRETAAHNTARVDGRDQAKHLGKMAWSHSYRARAEGWHAGEDCWFVGAHDGFDRSSDGVTHRRAVCYRRAGYVVVVDEFVGAGAHDLDVNFQFAPGERLVADSAGSVSYGDVARLHWVSSLPWNAVTMEGGEGPEAGWVAPSLGVRTPAPRLSLRTRSDRSRTVLLTVIAPLRRDLLVTAGDDAHHAVSGPGLRDVERVDTSATPRSIERAMLTIERAGEPACVVPAPAGRLWPAAHA